MATPQQSKADTDAKVPELPDHEQIASLAYSLWQARGCPEGSPNIDWIEAEKELTHV